MSNVSPMQRKRATITAIWEHYASVVHGIDSIYQGLEKNGLRVSVIPVDIQVISILVRINATAYAKTGKEFSTQVGALPGTHGFHLHYTPGTAGIVTSNKETVASDTALDAFYQWTQKDANLPNFDHAILITGYDLMEHGDKSKSGRAYLGTMCTPRSLSIVENDFSFAVVQISAHELGHSLSCRHDGEENNACSETDGYLMAAVIEINSTHRWHLSPCSVDYIRTLLTKLDRKRQMCLTTQDSELAGMNAVPMGELYTPDQQCALIETQGSYLCRSFYKTAREYETLCSNIWCHGTTSKDDLCNNYEGSEGFICGDMKVCEKGLCVFKETAPGAMDNCPQGDQPGIVWKNYTCEQLVINEPEMCYDDNTRQRCCLSCEEIKQNVPGCEYGDKSSWCRTNLVVPTGCYKNADLCCSTCKLAKDLTKPTCPYGDRSLWCKTKLKPPYDCYMNKELCCGTCEKYFNPHNVGCEFGDRSVWCESSLQPPHGCYKNAELCCGTCPRFRRPELPGCEYGDKSTWCETELAHPYGCYLNTEFCCKTCHQHLNASNIGCEYGDKHSDCLTLNYPSACYDNGDTCCGTCRNLRDDSQPGCEYGDKSSWCSTTLDPAYDCPLNLDLCCGTCAMDGSGISERQVYVYGRQLFTAFRKG